MTTVPTRGPDLATATHNTQDETWQVVPAAKVKIDTTPIDLCEYQAVMHELWGRAVEAGYEVEGCDVSDDNLTVTVYAEDTTVWVYMATARRGLGAHRLDGRDAPTTAGCGRSTRTGIRLTAEDASERYACTWCPRCFPDGSPLDPPSAAPSPTPDVKPAPTYPAVGSEIPDQPGYVVGACGHRVAMQEWRAGLRVCERCPNPAVTIATPPQQPTPAPTDQHPIVGTATWTPLHGDPAAGERGRWVVDTPDGGHVGIVELPHLDVMTQVAGRLRDLIETDRVQVTYLTYGVDTITAHGIPTEETMGRFAAVGRNQLMELVAIATARLDDGYWVMESDGTDAGDAVTVLADYHATADQASAELLGELSSKGLDIDRIEVSEDETTLTAWAWQPVAAPAPAPEPTPEHPQQGLIDGLRQLADLIAAHPDLPRIGVPSLSGCLTQRDSEGNTDEAASIGAVHQVAQILDLPVRVSRAASGRWHHMVTTYTGGCGVNLSYVSDTPPPGNCHSCGQTCPQHPVDTIRHPGTDAWWPGSPSKSLVWPSTTSHKREREGAIAEMGEPLVVKIAKLLPKRMPGAIVTVLAAQLGQPAEKVQSALLGMERDGMALRKGRYGTQHWTRGPRAATPEAAPGGEASTIDMLW